MSAAAAPAGPPATVLTPDNHGPVAVIFIICLMCISGSAAITRVWLSAKQRIPFKLDDVLYFLALLALLATTATLLAAEHFGLGKHMAKLSSSQIDTFNKLMYSFHLLGLGFATTFSKFSVVSLFKRILFERTKPMVHLLLNTMVAAYGLFVIFALAFQCDISAPWRFEPANCVTKGDLFYAIITLDMVTDIVLAAVILPDIWKLKMTRQQRLTIAILFGSRVVLVCIPCIFLLWQYAKNLRKMDQTWYWLVPAIIEFAISNLSFLATTLPRIHSYIAGLHGGLMLPVITDREHEAFTKERLERTTFTGSKTENSQVDAGRDADYEVPLKLVPSHEEPSRTVHLCGPESDCRKGPAARCVGSHRSSDEAMNHDGDDSQASLYNSDAIYTTQQFTITASDGKSRRAGRFS